MISGQGQEALLHAARCDVEPAFPGALYCLVLERLSLAAWGWLEQCLIEEERARANGLRFEAQRQAFIAAHGLVRLALGQRLGLPAGKVRLSTGGKPRILNEGGMRLDVSLAHTEGCVGCIIGSGMLVGVDVERAGVTPPFAEGWLSKDEQGWLAHLAPDIRDTACLDLWCRKEAVSKALGLGSAVDFRQLAVPREVRLSIIPVRSEVGVYKPPVYGAHGFHVALAILPFGRAGTRRWMSPLAPEAIIHGFRLA